MRNDSLTNATENDTSERISRSKLVVENWSTATKKNRLILLKLAQHLKNLFGVDMPTGHAEFIAWLLDKKNN